MGNKSPDSNDTKETWLKISDLKDDLTYELVLKAGNSKGMSTLTEPIRFTMSEKDVTSSASLGKLISFIKRKLLGPSKIFVVH